MKVIRLEGSLLDFWVAKSEGLKLMPEIRSGADESLLETGFWHPEIYRPSSNWYQGGPIVSNEWYDLENVLKEWFGAGWPHIKSISDEPLKWMMRAYVATKFGEEVEEIEESELSVLPMQVKTEPQAPATSKRWTSWFGCSKESGIKGY